MNAAHQGSLIADALSLPVHWYYDRDALDRDYPDLSDFQNPLPQHSGSILWRSSYEVLNEKGDILHDQAKYWGQRGIHYHQNLKAGENTVNFQLASLLYQMESYSPESWLELYVAKMLTPGWHRDTYLEEYHRAFFTRYAQGKPLLKCGIKDEHIGGLAHVPTLVAKFSGMEREELRQLVKTHVALTHRHSNVLRAADCLTRLLLEIESGTSIPDAIKALAGDWFSTKKATAWARQPDRTIIGEKLSPACYIDQSFPASLYLAWKYHDNFTAAITANARVGGDNSHRGAVVGSLVGLANPEQTKEWETKLLSPIS